MVQAGDLFGDGVNIAARIQSLAGSGRHLPLGHRRWSMSTNGCRTASSTWAVTRSRTSPSRSRVYALAGFGAPAAAAESAAGRHLAAAATSPSIAVLPFTNIGGDPEQEYFADGLVEDIITSLSRVRSFFVIARNSSFTYKGRAVDVRQVAPRAGRALRAGGQHPQGRHARARSSAS